MTSTVRPPGRRTPHVLRRVLAYSASRGVSEGLLGVRGVALAAMVGPAAFGTWALVRLSMRYVSMIGLGVFRGLELELLAGQSAGHVNDRADDAPAPVALGFTLLLTMTLTAAALGASFLIQDPSHVLALRGFAGAVVAEQAYTYVLVCARVRQDLRRYAILETTHSALQLVCVIALAWVGGLPGAFAGLALASVLTIVTLGRHTSLRPSLQLSTLRRLLREGTPLAINMMLTSALATGDRWVVAAFGGVTMLGYYAFAAQIASIGTTFAMVVRTVIFPEVYRNARSDRAAPVLRAHLERAVLPFARLFPPLLGAASLVIGPVLALALPRYVEAIGPARIFMLAGAAGGIVNLAAIGVVAAGKQRQLPQLSGLALAINLALSFLAVRSGAGLELVAAASFVGQTIFAIGVLTLIRRESGANEVNPFLMRALAPLAWCIVLVGLIGHFVPATDPTAAVLALALYLVLLGPLFPAMRADWQRLSR